MSERKSEANATFSSEVSDAIDVLRQWTGETRQAFVSRIIVEYVAREVDKANLLASKLAGKRIIQKVNE